MNIPNLNNWINIIRDKLKLMFRHITCHQSYSKLKACLDNKSYCQLIEKEICCYDCLQYPECDENIKCDF